MSKSTRKICIILLAALLISATVFALCACNDDETPQKTFSVTFKLNYEDAENVVKTYAEGESVSYVPVRAGFAFKGWTLDSAGRQPFDGTAADVTLYAQWQRETYRVRFYVGETLVKEKANAYYGNNIAPPTTAEIEAELPAGHVFLGWDSDDYLNVTKNLNIFAITAQSDSSVKFMASKADGAEVFKEFKGKSGYPIVLPSRDPSMRGFVFSYWVKANGEKYSENDKFTVGETVYYPYFTPAIPTTPLVSGSSEITYGSTLNLSIADAVGASGISFSYYWTDASGNKISETQALSVPQLSAGAYEYTATVVASSDINGETDSAKSSKTVTVTVKKAVLSASISAVTLNYGDALPNSLAISYTGFKFGDNESVIKSVTPSDSAYAVGFDIGSYTVPLDFDADNYAVKNLSGGEPTLALTVNPKRAIVSDSSVQKVYDGNKASKSYTITENLLPTHTLSLTLSTNGANVGDYSFENGEIGIENISLSDGNGRNVRFNYDIVFDVVMTVSAAEITYSAPEAVIYDTNAHTPTPLVLTDGVAISYSQDGTTFSETAPEFTDAGTYMLTIKLEKENYDTVTKEISFVINKRALSVKVIPNEISEGDALPEFKYEVSPYFPIDITFNCEYSAGNPSGEYPITAVYDEKNFEVTLSPAVLSVKAEAVKKPLYLTLSGNFEITYGDALPNYSILSAEGLQAGDTLESAVSGELSVECDYSVSKKAGVYALKIGGLTSEKYELYCEQTLTVAKARLVLTAAKPEAIEFGAPVPELTFTADGFKFDDDMTLLADAATFTTYRQGSPVNSYPVNVKVNGLTLENYDISVDSSVLEVTKATPIILTERDVYEIGYTGQVQQFMPFIMPESTNSDAEVSYSLSIESGRDGGIYHIVITSSETANFLPASGEVIVKICAAKIGYSIYTVEDALKIGGDIMLIGDAFLSENAAVKAGSSLILPCRENGLFSTFSNISDYFQYIDPLNEKLLYRLTVNNGVKLTISGRLGVGGETGQNGGAFQAHTTGMHSVIVAEENSEIIIENGGVLDCKGGFVLGEGVLTLKNGGTLKHNFVVRDFKGGTSTVGSYDKGGISPFNVFDMPNVQIFQNIEFGGKVIAYCDLYASSEHHTTEITVIGKSGTLLNMQDGAKITVKHNGAIGKNAPKLSVSTYGNVAVGSLRLTVTLMGTTVTVDMKDVYCPLSYIIDLHVFGNLSTHNAFKLLPGAAITVEKGGTLVVESGGGLTVYPDSWKDNVLVDTSGNSIIDGPNATTQYPHDKGGAVLCVKGTLSVLGGAEIGGEITGESGGKVNLGANVKTTITTIEGVAIKVAGGLAQQFRKTAEITTVATVVKGAEKIPCSQNNSYEF